MKAPALWPLVVLIAMPSCKKQKQQPQTSTQSKKQLLAEHKADCAYRYAQQQFADDLALITQDNTIPSNPTTMSRLKERILAYHNAVTTQERKKLISHNPYKNLPFLLYKTALDDTLALLEKRVRKLRPYQTPDAITYKKTSAHLIKQLQQLDHYILTFDEYHQELLVAGGSSSGLTSGLFKLGFAGLSAGVSKGVGTLL